MNINGINGMLPCDNGYGSNTYSSSHKAIDIGWLKKYSTNGKDPLKAFRDGTVIQSGKIQERINGKLYYPIVVVLQHDIGNNRLFTRYWHLDQTKVKVGQKVTFGQIIGIRGNTGYANGVHLHFELKICPKNTTYAQASNPWTRYNVIPVNYTFIQPNQHFTNYAYSLNKIPQIKILATQLRKRNGPSLSNSILGFCKPNDIYYVYDIITNDGYLWARIDKDVWIATKEGNWTIIIT